MSICPKGYREKEIITFLSAPDPLWTPGQNDITFRYIVIFYVQKVSSQVL